MEVTLDHSAQDKMEDEDPSVFHIIKIVKRRETRVIRQLVDMQGNNVSGHRKGLRTCTAHLRQKYEPIAVDQTCVTRLQEVIPLTCPTRYADLLQ